ncbi:response regulator [Vitiosangium sp. GDMCC 1.1324]|uniref:response regulator n=1 Tax=Vitiosangium sp. (strain GDMCC 1.1324) TaxID=2138576 RepID=UPI000D34B189|nr:response regulator [Vitiosangium sp. GDMCC 1.1324]PTL84436.1 two-component system response regulator [Vitiosangium sp. GDMCC 1.1324]
MKHTVLLVDDSDTIRHIIKVYLMKLKQLDFLDANRGDRGLKLLGASPVDLVIADVNMPGMNGLEFVRQVRASDRAEVSRVPIVLLTGGKAPDLEQRSREVGVSEFVRKPISSAALVAVVRRHLALPSDADDLVA